MSSRCVVHFTLTMSDIWSRKHEQPKQLLRESARSRIRQQASSQEPSSFNGFAVAVHASSIMEDVSSPDQVQPWPEDAKPKVPLMPASALVSLPEEGMVQQPV